MAELAYTVRATLVDAEQAEVYIRWLLGGHIAAVIAGGASGATVIRLDAIAGEGRVRVEVRYSFLSREAFDTYVRDHAPALRAEGQRLFGPTSGATFERSVGEVVGHRP